MEPSIYKNDSGPPKKGIKRLTEKREFKFFQVLAGSLIEINKDRSDHTSTITLLRIQDQKIITLL